MSQQQKTPKRIGIISHSGYPAEPRSRRLAEALVRDGYAVDVLCLQLAGQPKTERIAGVEVYRLPVAHHQGATTLVYLLEYVRFFIFGLFQLGRLHRRHAYSLVQVHNPPDALVFAALPLKLRRIPVILDLRELTPELFMSRFGLRRSSLVVRLLTLLERWSGVLADGVLVLHDRHRRIAAGRGFPEQKLTHVMNCPDERIFDPERFSWQRTGDEGEFVVLHHGGIMHRYGVDLLVEAVAKVRGRIPGLRLDLYGTGDFLPALQELAATLNVQDIVRFLGQQPLEAMPAAIIHADVGVAPMRQDVFTDCGLPTKLLEYVVLGLPAIASRTATTADYFDDSMVALFNPGDADDLAAKLLAVYDDREAARERAVRARRFSLRYNWPGERATYLDLVNRLIQPKP